MGFTKWCCRKVTTDGLHGEKKLPKGRYNWVSRNSVAERLPQTGVMKQYCRKIIIVRFHETLAERLPRMGVMKQWCRRTTMNRFHETLWPGRYHEWASWHNVTERLPWVGFMKRCCRKVTTDGLRIEYNEQVSRNAVTERLPRMGFMKQCYQKVTMGRFHGTLWPKGYYRWVSWKRVAERLPRMGFMKQCCRKGTMNQFHKTPLPTGAWKWLAWSTVGNTIFLNLHALLSTFGNVCMENSAPSPRGKTAATGSRYPACNESLILTLVECPQKKFRSSYRSFLAAMLFQRLRYKKFSSDDGRLCGKNEGMNGWKFINGA